MHAVLFHNPTAGGGDHSRDMLLAVLREAGLFATYCSTKDKLFPEMLQERADLFVAAGGDGTVGKVLKKMPDRNIPVLILPLGTANNIAHSLGVTGSLDVVVAGLKAPRKQRFEIGMVHGPWGHRPFIEGVGLGSLTETMIRIHEAESGYGDGLRLGREMFRKVLGEARPNRFRLSVDGRVLDAELLLLEILNISFAGARLPLAPQGRVGDGIFDIVTIKPDQRADMLTWLGAADRNGPAPVTLQQGRTIRVDWETAALHVDDDWPDGANHHNSIKIEFAGEPVTIIVPERPEHRDRT